jgi:hypothetical protein
MATKHIYNLITLLSLGLSLSTSAFVNLEVPVFKVRVLSKDLRPVPNAGITSAGHYSKKVLRFLGHIWETPGWKWASKTSFYNSFTTDSDGELLLGDMKVNSWALTSKEPYVYIYFSSVKTKCKSKSLLINSKVDGQDDNGDRPLCHFYFRPENAPFPTEGVCVLDKDLEEINNEVKRIESECKS